MEPVDIVCRCYVEPKGQFKVRNRKTVEQVWSPSRSLVFDAETTVDQYQNLIFGDSQIYDHGELETEVIYSGDIEPDDQRS